MKDLRPVTGDYLCDPATGELHDAETFDDDYLTWMVNEGGDCAYLPRVGTWVGPNEASAFGYYMTAERRQEELFAVLQDVTAHGTMMRRAMCAEDPALFSLIYLQDSLRNDQGLITFSDLHFYAYADAKTWTKKPYELFALYGDLAPSRRVAICAPRQGAKSHLYAKILPIWAACYGYIRFMVFASDAADEAASHMKWWKHQIASNAWLRLDFPEMCLFPLEANDTDLVLRNGFRCSFGGMEGAWRGIIDVDNRPDYVCTDDVDAKSPGKIPARRKLFEAVFDYLGASAIQRLMGTNTGPGNITDDLMRPIFGREPADWCRLWDALHIKPIPRSKRTNQERSWWPRTRFLTWEEAGEDSLIHRREFQTSWNHEMENLPHLGKGALYQQKYVRRLSREDIMDGTWQPTSVWVEVDPAVTAHEKSDYTAIGLWAYRWTPMGGELALIDSITLKVLGEEQYQAIQDMVDRSPWGCDGVYLEDNQGGTNWRHALAALTVPLYLFSSKTNKFRRLNAAADPYRKGQVLHCGVQAEVEEQQFSYAGEKSLEHYDAMDMAANAILRAFQPELLGITKEPEYGARTIGGLA